MVFTAYLQKERRRIDMNTKYIVWLGWHVIDMHYDNYENAYDAQQYWIDAGYYDVQIEEYTSGDYINSRRRI